MCDTGVLQMSTIRVSFSLRQLALDDDLDFVFSIPVEDGDWYMSAADPDGGGGDDDDDNDGDDDEIGNNLTLMQDFFSL